jgi:hypothetical protein
MFMLNGSPLAIDTPFTHNEIQYPANWLRLTTLEEKEAIGIIEVADPAYHDDRFYWGVGNPKDLDQCKANLIAQIKQTAGSLLVPTDWKVVRFAETGQSMGSDATAYRAAIRTASNANESAVAACTTVDELAALQLTWPEIENV